MSVIGQQASGGRGRLIILSAPSGTGKTTIARTIAAGHPKIQVSVSHTTRRPRPEEKHGQDYFFVDRQSFLDMIANDQFLEYAEVFDHYYGTSHRAVKRHLADGISVLLVIDWRGARLVRGRFKDVLSVFFVPPSYSVLERRLVERGQDTDTVMKRRLQEALEEVRHHHEYDHVIVNDHFETAVEECEKLIFSAVVPTSGRYFDPASFIATMKNGTLRNSRDDD